MKQVFVPLVGCLLVSAAASAYDYVTVEIPEGDVDALVAAMVSANDAGDAQVTTIRVSGEYVITNDAKLPPIQTYLHIYGPARIRGTGSIYSTQSGEKYGPRMLFHVESGWTLDLRDIEFKDFSLNHGGRGLLVNEGDLSLTHVQFTNVATDISCLAENQCTPHMPILYNRGEGYLAHPDLSVVYTTFVNAGYTGSDLAGGGGILQNLANAEFKESQVSLAGAEWLPPIRNNGYLTISNTSFLQDSNRADPPALQLSSAISVSRYVNSVIVGFSSSICDAATSLGHNLIDADSCSWSSAGDVTGWTGTLVWKANNRNRASDPVQIPSHILVPEHYDAAVYTGNPTFCSLYDILGNAREWQSMPLPPGLRYDVTECSKGAVEVEKVGLSDGGINGLYYNPDADGHYVQILQTDYVTLVVWNTFDNDGNQVWVYGTGELVDGRFVVAETYINRDVSIRPGNADSEPTAEFWGTLDVEMESCMKGRMKYQSVDPGFGDGEFPIERLAFVKQLGCGD